jgi:hypothetical protein
MLHRGCIYRAPDGQLCKAEEVKKTGPVTFVNVVSNPAPDNFLRSVYSPLQTNFTLTRRTANTLEEHECFHKCRHS